MWYIKEVTETSIDFYIGNDEKTLEVNPEFLSKKFLKKNPAASVFAEAYENLLIAQGFKILNAPLISETYGIKEVPDCMRQMIEYAKNSVKVTVDKQHGWVTICDPLDDRDDDGIFLQNEDGYNFVDAVDKLWNEYDLTYEEAEYLAVYPYCDMF